MPIAIYVDHFRTHLPELEKDNPICAQPRFGRLPVDMHTLSLPM